ncbi:unnamed protein product [Phytomonas sp. Hart1]|nr:unnamed protein product [Phytomonas sp. Hart1]|eukprot:CCW66242.1 unnamed protein product [Phytomonas sp. isolate Hart1]
MPAVDQPLVVGFSNHVELTIHDAFLASAGVLQCNPVARVFVMTVKTLLDPGTTAANTAAVVSPTSVLSPMYNNIQPIDKKKKTDEKRLSNNPSSDPRKSPVESARGVQVTINTREVGRTTPRLFTCRPSFGETVGFDVEDSSSLTSLTNKPPDAAYNARDQYKTTGRRDANLNKSDPQGLVAGSTQTIEDYVVIVIEEAEAPSGSRRCFGVAYCPFSPHCESASPSERPVKVMLQPRNVHDPADPLFLEDMRVLMEQRLDDFGHVGVSWHVRMRPHGGALQGVEHPLAAGAAAPSFPLGLTLKCTWLAPSYLTNEDGAGLTTSVEFGGMERFAFAGPRRPMFLTIRSAAQLRVVNLHCSAPGLSQQPCEKASGHGLGLSQSLSHSQGLSQSLSQSQWDQGEATVTDVLVSLPLPPLSTLQGLDRDVHWAAPVRTSQGADWGILLASIRLSRRQLEGGTPICGVERCPRINDPLHQEEFAHVAWDGKVKTEGGNDDAPPIPDTPLSAYQPVMWESEGHVAAAARRAWRRRCVLEAQPMAEHVRHLFEVLMGRTGIDAGVANVASTFFNRSIQELTAADLKELMVAFAFHAKGLSAIEAASFCFVALRRDVENAIALEEVHYLLEHSLIGKTCDMPQSEIRRWVTDIFGTLSHVSFEHFKQYFLHNYAMWAAFGVPLAVNVASSSAQRHHHVVGPLSEVLAGGLSALPLEHIDRQTPPQEAAGGGITAAPPERIQAPRSLSSRTASPNAKANGWRTFVVIVSSTKKTFSVTAHVEDTIGDAMLMVEESCGIKAALQEWWLGGETRLSGKTRIGNTVLGVPPALKSSRGTSPQTSPPLADVVIKEQDGTILIHYSYKAKNMRWHERVPTEERVLKLRAAVQRKTLIPLSRCVLRVVPAGSSGGKEGKMNGTSAVILHDRHPISHYNLQSGVTIEVLQE